VTPQRKIYISSGWDCKPYLFHVLAITYSLISHSTHLGHYNR